MHLLIYYPCERVLCSAEFAERSFMEMRIVPAFKLSKSKLLN